MNENSEKKIDKRYLSSLNSIEGSERVQKWFKIYSRCRGSVMYKRLCRPHFLPLLIAIVDFLLLWLWNCGVVVYKQLWCVGAPQVALASSQEWRRSRPAAGPSTAAPQSDPARPPAKTDPCQAAGWHWEGDNTSAVTAVTPSSLVDSDRGWWHTWTSLLLKSCR